MKFRMVDRILSWAPGVSIGGAKTVSFEEYCLKAPFGDAARLPESLLVESFFELMSWFVILSSDFKSLAIVTGVRRVTFDGPLEPGERMVLKVDLREERRGALRFDGTGLVEKRRVALVEGCLAKAVLLSSYFDPGDVRILYQEIYRPEEAKAP